MMLEGPWSSRPGRLQHGCARVGRRMVASSSADTSRLDRWTVGAIAVIAYAVGNVVHEGLGHGGACSWWAAGPRS